MTSTGRKMAERRVDYGIHHGTGVVFAETDFDLADREKHQTRGNYHPDRAVRQHRGGSWDDVTFPSAGDRHVRFRRDCTPGLCRQ